MHYTVPVRNDQTPSTDQVGLASFTTLPERTMPANLKLRSALGATILALGAIPALAHDRLDPASAEPVGATAKLHNLVLYSDARLAFYGSETPRRGCRDRSGDNVATHATPTTRSGE
jgi:hypothetical protein